VTPDRPFEVRDDLRGVVPYSPPTADAPIKLNSNESPWPPPEGFRAELADRVRTLALHRYPDRMMTGLREAFGARHSWPGAGVWIANGSNEILQTVLLTFAGPGRRVLVFEPTYTVYPHITRLTGAELVRVEVAEPWVLDPSFVRSAIARVEPAVTLICSPNNPTGTLQPTEVFTAAIGAARGLVIADEAYGDFAPSTALDILGRSDRLVVARSFSKSWRLAGARIGYLLAHPWLVDAIQVARLPYHVSALTQACAEVALRNAAAMTETVEEVVAERERLAKELERVPGVEVSPSAANFLLVRTPLEGSELWRGLADHGVLVRDFSELIPRALRVTVGSSDQNAAFVEALRGALADAGA
jgi:histidinol-phosphate aminotransferase